METTTVRLRLVFDRTLANLQKTEGLKRCWFLLKPQHQTISDLSSYVLDSFELRGACPNGILLAMEGFVLPPFESTSILKDKDIIRVKSKAGSCGGSIEIVPAGNGVGTLDAVEIVQNPPVATGMNLLANEEFREESGGYESESEEEEDSLEEQAMVKATETTRVSKKRKASNDIQSSKKRKKSKSATAEKHQKHAVKLEDAGNNVSGANGGSNKNGGAMPSTRSSEPPENANGSSQEALTPAGSKKPSRSARRKKAKRKWLREKLKAEREAQNQIEQAIKIHHHPSERHNKKPSEEIPENRTHEEKPENMTPEMLETLPNKDKKHLKQEHQQPSQDSDADDDVVPVVIRPGHIRFESLRKVGANQPVQSNQSPLPSLQWNGITSKKKGQKWGKEKGASSQRSEYKKSDQEWGKKKGASSKWSEYKKSDQEWGKEKGASSKWSEYKKSDQEWGKEKDAPSKWSDYKKCNQEWGKEKGESSKWSDQEWSKGPSTDEGKPKRDYIDFDKLPLYTTLPKVGDVIAYRLIELSTSWTPELSSYRVGKISQHNLESNMIKLVQVPEYPPSLEGKMDDETSALLPEPSPFSEDGSLEIKFSSLLEVRVVKMENQNSVQTEAGGANELCVRDQDPATGSIPNNNNAAHASSQENGKVNVWDEVSQALDAKKAQLSQEDNWTRSETSGRSPWSYRALRGSALGPTMALLRAQNEI